MTSCIVSRYLLKRSANFFFPSVMTFHVLGQQYSLNLEDVQVSVADHSSLTAELLELTCLLSNLVNVWNSRISSVLEQVLARQLHVFFLITRRLF